MRWAVLVIIAFALVVVGPRADTGPATAEAQVWKPESKKRKKKPAKKRRRKRRSRSKAKAKPPVTESANDDDDDIEEEVIDEDDDDDDDDDDDNDDIDDDDNDDDNVDDEKPPDDGEPFSLEGPEAKKPATGASTDESTSAEDDLEEVGDDVSWTEDELSEASTGQNLTRLETLAMGYARLGVDAIHDPVPVAPTGVKAIGEDTLSFRTHGRAEGTGRFGKRYKVKVSGRVNADLSLDGDTHIGVERYEAEVWDTYLDAYWSWLDLRFGQQMIAWGAADLLSPNDVVNAKDLRRGFLDRPEELRLPVLALSARVYDGPFSAQALWIPVAPTNRFELLEGDYALLGPNGATAVERRIGAIVSTLLDDPVFGPQLSPFVDIAQSPDKGLDTGELGGKVELRFQHLDIAGYALWGHERNASIKLHPSLRQALVETAPDDYSPEGVAMAITGVQMAGGIPIEVSYPRKLHFGASLAGRLEPVGVKVDFGYDWAAIATLVPKGGGPLLAVPDRLPQFGATVSFDYDRGSDFTLILEGTHLQVLNVPEDLDVFQYDHDQLNLVASRFEWTPASGPATLRLLGTVDPVSKSYALRPALRLSGHDNLSLEIAATLFGGPSGSYGGVANRNDEIMITAQYGL